MRFSSVPFLHCLPFQNTHKAAFYRWLSDGELVGSIAYFAGQNSAPDGWVLCDGSAVSRETYATLFAAVGITYGAGDGTDTFNLPNLIDKFVEGSATAGTEHSAGLPNIKGDLSYGGAVGNLYDTSGNGLAGAFLVKGQSIGGRLSYSSGTSGMTEFDASKSNSIYGASTTVQPPSVTMKPFIYTGKTSVNKWKRTA